MSRRSVNLLIVVFLIIVVLLIDLPVLKDLKSSIFKRELNPVLGLDLRGGMQVILQAPAGFNIDQQLLEETTPYLLCLLLSSLHT